eukprot:TRINITY_DN4973_c0_g1_i2.p1 TRINITY_DN4973_c0_g1~~TRINITY_DN4973_c0_g1_i2.p1  ORF type:complete len:278 (-),score=52.69 TRINITY_DN4973_c0_g1_i2:8-841(-)
MEDKESTKKILIIAGAALGVIAAVAGVIFISRRKSSTPTPISKAKKDKQVLLHEEKQNTPVASVVLNDATTRSTPTEEDFKPIGSRVEERPPPVESQDPLTSEDILGFWVPTHDNSSGNLPNYEFLSSGVVKLFTRYEFLEGEYTIDTKSKKLKIVVNLPPPLGTQTIPLSYLKPAEGEVIIQAQGSEYKRGEKPSLKIPPQYENKSIEERYAAFVDEFADIEYPQIRDQSEILAVLQKVYEKREELLTKYGLSMEDFSTLQKSTHPIVVNANKKLQ